MKKNTIPLESERFYHVYNRGINACEIFTSNEDYLKFLTLMKKYLVGNYFIYSWVLIPNHFHFLLQIPESMERPLNLPMSNLCNSYAQYYNKRHDRHGGLFERPFRRKLIETDEYLKELVLYIHRNPQNHLLCDHILEYPWSSYGEIIGIEIRDTIVSKTESNQIIEWFDNVRNFKSLI